MANLKVFDRVSVNAFKDYTKSNGMRVLSNNGAFTRAMVNDQNVVALLSVCPIKACMAEMGFHESYDFMPQIDRLHKVDMYVYEMPRYETTRALKSALHPDEYDRYLTLCAIMNRFQNHLVSFDHNHYDNYNILYDIFGDFENRLGSEFVEQIRDVIGDMASYTHKLSYEISPRNVAVKNGKLILLDCFFCLDTLHKVKS